MGHRRMILVSSALLLVLAACGQPSGTENAGSGNLSNQPTPRASAQPQAQPSAAGTTIQPVIATSELVVGPNRMALGILDNNVPIKDAAQAKVKLRYYRLSSTQGRLVGEEDTRFYGENLGERGTFIAHPTFDTAGNWGLEVIVQRTNQQPLTFRQTVEIKERGTAPKIGDPAPRSKTPTVKDVTDLRTISSDSNPDPRFYQISVADAVSSGKPSLILFATPGFCETATCGPGIDVLRRLKDQVGDKVNAVHVEVYKLPYDQGKMVPTMQEWGLQTEPWLFLVGKDGKIVGRYEGGITYQELEPDVTKLVSQ